MRDIYMKGSYVKGDSSYYLYAISNSSNIELFITDMYSHIVSAYKAVGLEEYSYLTSDAKELWKFIKTGIARCSNKKVTAAPIVGLGTIKRYSVTKGASNWSIDKYDGQFSGCEADGAIGSDTVKVYLEYTSPYAKVDLNYVKLTNYANYTIKSATNPSSSEFDEQADFEETIPVRSLAEIGLEKDTTWLEEKHYYIVNDEAQAEQIFKYLENYKGIISYDTETTGLCINMFGEIGSERKAKIDAENERLRAEGKLPYKVDRLVGIIFCIERNISYYFPCFNRKFKNIYSDKSDENTKKVIDRIYARYTVGDLRDSTTSMSNYIRNTPKEEWQSDVILMERVRDILEKGWLGTHHGSFEYKVGLMYSIDSNLKDDSMLLHQLLYKFRNINSSNDRGEPSNLKYLTKVEFGVDQLDLKDFFVDYSEDSTGLAKQSGKKKKGSKIDFSYMDYDGAKAYAPADGDFTLGLILKYKKGLYSDELKKQEYIYNVEIVVSCAIGYMEYYGHRLDEDKIEATKINTYTNMLLTEKKIRDLINANTEKELAEFAKLVDLSSQLKDLEESMKSDKSPELKEKYKEVLHSLDEQNMFVRNMIDTSENQLNLASPAQVGELFYDRLSIPVGKDGVRSVSKRAIKPLAKAKNEDMSLKYPVVKYYMDWKNDSTLLTKFFDNLPNYMYPGGFIFSGYGQIATATGRMSCSHPNAQQYPHSVTCMVIPRDNYVFADADYSQIEYRTLTALAKEKSLMEKFKDPDMDYHTTMASLMYDTPYANVSSQMRSEAKTFNFGIPYGMGLKKLAFQLKGSEDASAVAEAKEKYELYFKEQPNVRRFFDDVKEKARVYNYTETKWGRRRYYSFNDESGRLDTRKMSASLRQAGNAVIQGSAADIFKIGVARNFLFIRENHLFGKYLITNMIHDEQLVEISCELNVKVILANLIKAMELHIDGFPPLYVGAGIGSSWDEAKGKMAEIHPLLGRQFVKECDDSGDVLYADESTKMTPEQVYDYFQNRNYGFREQKILNYVLDSNNYGETLHPVIGALLGLQFDYGVKKDLKERFPDNLEGIAYTKEEKEEAERASPLERLRRFIEAHNLNIPIDNFKSATVEEEVKEEDTEYVDEDEEEDGLDVDDDYGLTSSFKLIDESSEHYGCSLKDLIREFGFVISKSNGLVGINWNKLTSSSQRQVQLYLNAHACDEGTRGAYRVVLLNNAGQLKPEPNEPQFYITAVSEEQFMSKIKLDE